MRIKPRLKLDYFSFFQKIAQNWIFFFLVFVSLSILFIFFYWKISSYFFSKENTSQIIEFENKNYEEFFELWKEKEEKEKEILEKKLNFPF